MNQKIIQHVGSVMKNEEGGFDRFMKTSDTLSLALYQIIKLKFEKYEQGIMPQFMLSKLSNIAFVSDSNGFTNCGRSWPCYNSPESGINHI